MLGKQHAKGEEGTNILILMLITAIQITCSEALLLQSQVPSVCSGTNWPSNSNHTALPPFFPSCSEQGQPLHARRAAQWLHCFACLFLFVCFFF